MGRIWTRRFLMFGLTGALNFAFGYGLFAALYLAGLHPQWALGISFAIGVVWNYFTHARFVFGQSGFNRLPGYILVYIFTYFVNRWGLALAIEQGISPLVAQFVLIFVTFIISFFAISFVLLGRLPFTRDPGGPENGQSPG